MQSINKYFRLEKILSVAAMPIALAIALVQPVAAHEPLPVPVSINALMVTLIDHSAHHVWDMDAMDRELTDEEWRMVEYFAIQLAAAGPLITLGGTGPHDAAWVASEQWTNFSQALSSAALIGMDAAKTKNRSLLTSAGDALVTTCEGCHTSFKPASSTEGILHLPDYDHLYHLFE